MSQKIDLLLWGKLFNSGHIILIPNNCHSRYAEVLPRNRLFVPNYLLLKYYDVPLIDFVLIKYDAAVMFSQSSAVHCGGRPVDELRDGRQSVSAPGHM